MQHPRGEPLRSGIRGGVRQRIEIVLTVGQPRQHRHGQHPRRDSGFPQRAHRTQPQVRTRRPRLEQTRQVGAHRGDAQIHHDRRALRNSLQQVQIAQHLIGLGGDGKAQTLALR